MRALNSRNIVCTSVVLALVALCKAGEPVAPGADMPPAVTPAALMPPDTLVYVELVKPGQQLDEVVKLVQRGGIADPFSALAARANGGPKSQPVAAPVNPAMMAMMFLNPSLVTELGKVQGVAAGLVRLPAAQGGPAKPEWLAVVQPGQSDALRGLLQMLIAAGSETVEPIAGGTLNRLKGGEAVYAAVIAGNVLVGMPREVVVAGVERMQGRLRDSLAGQGKFTTATSGRSAGLIAYADVERLIGAAGALPEHDRREFAMVSRLMGLDALSDAVLQQRFTPEGLEIDLQVGLKDGRSSDLYDMMRTPPADRELLAYVPGDALGLATVSLGDGGARFEQVCGLIRSAMEMERQEHGGQGSQELDEEIAKAEEKLGFGIKEACESVKSVTLAVLPPDLRAAPTSRPGGSHGMHVTPMVWAQSLLAVARVSDVEAFNGLLDKLAEAVSREAKQDDENAQPVQMERRTVKGRELRAYTLPGAPVRVIVANEGDVFVLAFSEATVTAALDTKAAKRVSVLGEAAVSAALSGVPKQASKIVLVRPDGILQLVLAAHGQPTTLPAGAGTAMKASVVYTVEDPARLEMHARANGLAGLMLRVMPLVGHHAPRHHVVAASRAE